MKQLQHAALAAVALLCLNFKEIKAQKIVFQNLSYAKAIEKAKKENKLVFLDVYTTWCGPCKMLEKNVFSQAKVGTYFNKNFICIHIDGDTGEGQLIAEKLKLKGYPSLYFIDGNDQLIDKSVGYLEANALLDFANYAQHPEKKPSNILKAKYEKGDRSLSVIYAYSSALNDNGEDYKPMLNTYLEKVPSESILKNDSLFSLFVISRNNLKPIGHNNYFIKNISQFHNKYGKDEISGVVYKMAEAELKNWEISANKAVVEKEIYWFCKNTLPQHDYVEIEAQLKDIFSK
jgi:thiol-disulfide isomerase/thioredoxin